MIQLIVRVEIPGAPFGKQRPRAVIRGAHAGVYTPKETIAWEAAAARDFREAWGQAPLVRPIAVRILAVGQRPGTELPSKRAAKLEPELLGRLWRPTKPDADNVAKATLDALQQGGVVCDDKLVVHVEVLSLWTAIDEAPRTEVEVYEVHPSLAALPRRCR